MNKALEIEETDDYILKYASLLQDYGHDNLAAQYYQKYLKNNPNQVEIILDLAYCLDNTGETEKTILWLEKAIVLDKDNEEIEYLLCDNYELHIDQLIDNKKYKEALETAEKVVFHNENSIPLQFLLFKTMYLNNKREEADQKITTLMKKHKKDPFAHMILGNHFLEFKEFSKTKDSYDTALKLSQKNPSLILTICEFLVIHKNENLAEEYLKIFIKMNKDKADAYNRAGNILESEKAIIYLNKAYQLEPNNSEYILNLISCNMHFGYINEANMLIEKTQYLFNPSHPLYEEIYETKMLIQDILANPQMYRRKIRD